MMIQILLFLLYNLFLIPLVFLLLHLLIPFHRKIRQGLLGRYRTIPRLRRGLQGVDPSRPRYLLHAASLGEFEHSKAFLRRLKQEQPDAFIVVMFFSPSGYEHVQKEPFVDLFVYTPFDWVLPVWRLYRLLRPWALFIARYDVWANQIWLADLLGIPCFLLNASLPPDSLRLLPPVRLLLRPLYQKFTRILAISEEDARRFLLLCPQEKVSVVGDTKFDQVWIRREEAASQPILPPALLAGRKVLVCGSIWPEDEQHLIPALRKLIPEMPDLLAILCPHEPEAEHLQRLREAFPGLPVTLFSQLSEGQRPAILLIDRVGILALLYSVAQVAYVGGGFRQNVHNVLEPAVYGLPVLFGPHNTASREAQLLKKAQGGFEVYNGEEIYLILKKLFSQETLRCEAGKHALAVARRYRGATRKALALIQQDLRQYRSGE